MIIPYCTDGTPKYIKKISLPTDAQRTPDKHHILLILHTLVETTVPSSPICEMAVDQFAPVYRHEAVRTELQSGGHSST